MSILWIAVAAVFLIVLLLTWGIARLGSAAGNIMERISTMSFND